MSQKKELKITEAGIEVFAQSHVWEILISTVQALIEDHVRSFFHDTETTASEQNLTDWLEEARSLPLDIISEDKSLSEHTFESAFADNTFIDPLLLEALAKIIPEFQNSIEAYTTNHYPDFETHLGLITLLFGTDTALVVSTALLYKTLAPSELENGEIKPQNLRFDEITAAIYHALVSQAETKVPPELPEETIKEILGESGVKTAIAGEIVEKSKINSFDGVLLLLNLLSPEQREQIAYVISQISSGNKTASAADLEEVYNNSHFGG